MLPRTRLERGKAQCRRERIHMEPTKLRPGGNGLQIRRISFSQASVLGPMDLTVSIVQRCAQGTRFISTETVDTEPAPPSGFFMLCVQSSERSIEAQPLSDVLLELSLDLESTLEPIYQPTPLLDVTREKSNVMRLQKTTSSLAEFEIRERPNRFP